MIRLAIRVAAVAAVVVIGVLSWSSIAWADNCSGPGDCEETGGYNGAIAVVGGVAAVMAAAAAAVARTPEGKETDLSIVQVSTDTLDVLPGEPAVLTLTGWHVGSDKQLRRVAMQLVIEVPPESGITVTPSSGTGELVATVAVDEASPPASPDPVELVARGTWNGKTASETVVVHASGDLELRLTEEPDDE